MSDLIAARRPAQESWMPRRVLLVEDNPGDAELACERLTEMSPSAFDISHAASVREAIELLSAQPMDAIILDLGLPDSEGVETVRRIRILLRGTPIIVVTGHVDDELRTRALDAGVDEVYSKDEANSRLFWRSVLQIIERRRAQQRQLELLLDAMPDAVLVVNLEGLVRYANKAALDLFGRQRDELLDSALGLPVGGAEPAEIVLAHPGGDRVCEMRAVPLVWNEESTHLAAVRDVTERRQAERLRQRSAELEDENRRILQANRTKSAFLANMSHELRTPLNAIIGFSQMIHDGRVDTASEKFRRFVGHILTSGKHLLELINDVLDLAKVEAGKLEFRPRPVDLLPTIHEVVDILGSISVQKQIWVDVQVQAPLEDISIDVGRFKQVLYNYLSNALKFTPKGGSVTVRVKAEGEQAFRLEVEDTGVGIGTNDLPRLFSEFQQLGDGAAKTHQGTGLGLALTKKLVQAQGGSVAVRSELGRGSVFSAVFPRQPPHSQETGP